MADMSGKTCVITGATSGIGLETAIGLARAGASLVLVGRDPARGRMAQARLEREAPGSAVRIEYADLARLDEVRRLGALLAALPRLDVLINNAGAIFQRRAVTQDGLERTFALNHMAYFLLTDILRPRLLASAPARIVNVASEAHRGAALDFDDLQSAHGYSGWKAYQRSKLCNILFTRELARRLAGSGVTANCLHPGFVASRFGDDNGGWFRLAIAVGKRLMAISPQDGARTSLHVAAAPEIAALNGLYFRKSEPARPSAEAQDDAAAARLWQESERLAGTAGAGSSPNL